MLSSRLQTYFLLATTALILHGAEEYQGNQLRVDPVFRWFAQLFGPFTADQSLFLVFHVLVVVGLLVSLMATRTGGLLVLHSIMALVLILEGYHLVLSLFFWRYLPGITTTILLITIGVVYWQQLIPQWRHYLAQHRPFPRHTLITH